MFLVVDIGGTKTLLAVFTPEGEVIKENRFETDENFDDFIAHLVDMIKQVAPDGVDKIIVGAPGRLDRENGVGIRFGNLGWQNVPIKARLAEHFDVDIHIENDAKLAGLGEMHALPKLPRVGLYVTISTGIGVGIITDGEINPYLQNAEAGFMLVPRDGELAAWEHVASGKAILERYHTMAKDIHDDDTWREICDLLAPGFNNLITCYQPDVIVVGGSVGQYLERYHDFLVEAIESFKISMYTIPPITKAKHPDEAVIYGGYQYARQRADNN